MPALPSERYITLLDAAYAAIKVTEDIHEKAIYARDNSPELEEARNLISSDPARAAEILYSAYNGLIDLILDQKLDVKVQISLAREHEHFSRTSKRTPEARKRMRILRETRRSLGVPNGEFAYTLADFERDQKAE